VLTGHKAVSTDRLKFYEELKVKLLQQLDRLRLSRWRAPTHRQRLTSTRRQVAGRQQRRQLVAPSMPASCALGRTASVCQPPPSPITRFFLVRRRHGPPPEFREISPRVVNFQTRYEAIRAFTAIFDEFGAEFLCLNRRLLSLAVLVWVNAATGLTVPVAGAQLAAQPPRGLEG
jgi:hypothetical protein